MCYGRGTYRSVYWRPQDRCDVYTSTVGVDEGDEEIEEGAQKRTVSTSLTATTAATVAPSTASTCITTSSSSSTSSSSTSTSSTVADPANTTTTTAQTTSTSKPAGSNGEPLISDVSGVARDGKKITITGSGFGSLGPIIVLFENFKRGTDGELITLDAPVGNWSGVQDYHAPYYGTDSEGNVTGYLIRNNSVGRIYAKFADVQEIFISYRVMIPQGDHFPNSGAPNTFPAGSQWKLTWLMDGDRGASGNDDLVIPTGNGTYFSIAGNDNAFQSATGRPGSSDNWFSFAGWNRFSVYMSGGAIPDVDPGTTWSQGMSEEFGQHVFTSEKKLFDGDDSPDGYKFEDDAISRWNRLNVPGWHRGGDDDAGAMYDDMYIATGPHARARIEIGNDPSYAKSTELAIATPISWADGSVTAKIRSGSFRAGETVYVFVIDEDGNASAGYPLTLD